MSTSARPARERSWWLLRRCSGWKWHLLMLGSPVFSMAIVGLPQCVTSGRFWWLEGAGRHHASRRGCALAWVWQSSYCQRAA